MTYTTRRLIPAALLAAALTTGGAFAQGMGPGMGGMGGMGPGMGPGMGMGKGMGMGRGGCMQGPIAEQRLDGLKAKLGITPAQEPAWNAFRAEAQKQSEAMRAMRGQAMTAKTWPERAQAHTEMMKQRVAGMESVHKAMGELYNQLTPEQKAVMDQQRPGRGFWRG